MTVAELIEKLQEFPGNLEVVTEGCDCDGDVVDVELDPSYDGKQVAYLRRS